jgi:hypothetical protein
LDASVDGFQFSEMLVWSNAATVRLDGVVGGVVSGHALVLANTVATGEVPPDALKLATPRP